MSDDVLTARLQAFGALGILEGEDEVNGAPPYVAGAIAQRLELLCPGDTLLARVRREVASGHPLAGVDLTPLELDLALELTELEAHDLHHAIAVVVQLLEQVTPPSGAPLQPASAERLLAVARRLDHERRHRGRVPNPNRPA